MIEKPFTVSMYTPAGMGERLADRTFETLSEATKFLHEAVDSGQWFSVTLSVALYQWEYS